MNQLSMSFTLLYEQTEVSSQDWLSILWISRRLAN